MSRFAEVLDVAAGAGARVRRGWPRSAEHLLLELETPAGRCAAQWFDDPAVAAEATRRTPGARRSDRLVLQPNGADRRLPLLAALVAAGDRLVAHRPGRRAVLRARDGWVKLVRPARGPRLLAGARAAESLPLATPRVLDADPAAGVVRLATVPGTPLPDLLGGPDAERACHRLGAATALLHAAPVPVGSTAHDAVAEVAVLRRWQDLAAAWEVLPEAAPTAAPVPPSGVATALVHRDLHDGQVLLDGDAVGLLDFDLAAVGDPALDIGNLLAHLRLREQQGVVADAGPLREAFWAGYRPDLALATRIATYEDLAWQRLLAVYAFRPRGEG